MRLLAWKNKDEHGITRQRPSCIDRRDRSPQLRQIGFEKVFGDYQRLDRLARITAAGHDGLVASCVAGNRTLASPALCRIQTGAMPAATNTRGKLARLR
jgi:hypothetical protein